MSNAAPSPSSTSSNAFPGDLFLLRVDRPIDDSTLTRLSRSPRLSRQRWPTVRQPRLLHPLRISAAFARHRLAWFRCSRAERPLPTRRADQAIQHGEANGTYIRFGEHTLSPASHRHSATTLNSFSLNRSLLWLV